MLDRVSVSARTSIVLSDPTHAPRFLPSLHKCPDMILFNHGYTISSVIDIVYVSGGLKLNIQEAHSVAH